MILPDCDLDEDVDACSDEHPRVPRLVWGEEGEHSSSDRDSDGVVNKGGYHSGSTVSVVDSRRWAPPCMTIRATSSGDWPGKWIGSSSSAFDG